MTDEEFDRELDRTPVQLDRIENMLRWLVEDKIMDAECPEDSSVDEWEDIEKRVKKMVKKIEKENLDLRRKLLNTEQRMEKMVSDEAHQSLFNEKLLLEKENARLIAERDADCEAMEKLKEDYIWIDRHDPSCPTITEGPLHGCDCQETFDRLRRDLEEAKALIDLGGVSYQQYMKMDQENKELRGDLEDARGHTGRVLKTYGETLAEVKELQEELSQEKKFHSQELELRVKLVREVKELREVLGEVEWGGWVSMWKGEDGTVQGDSSCPICVMPKMTGHAKDCRLAKALGRGK